MASSKDKTEDELDAVTAAYESISAKLEELRKKQAATSDEDEMEKPAKKNTEPDSDDEDAVAEIDIESKEQLEVEVKSKKAKPGQDQEEEPLEPLPGTESDPEKASTDKEEPELPKKQVFKENDPLDEETEVENEPQDDAGPDKDDFEEESPTLSQRGAKAREDEMEKWEKMHSGQTDSEADEETAIKSTYTPLSQDEFQSRLRRPQDDELSDVSHQTSEKNNSAEDRRLKTEDDQDEPDSLDDLAEETNQEQPFANSASRPTSVEGLEDDWGIRHLKPQHGGHISQENSEFESPPKPFKRPAVDEENYFDRRGQPLPRKKASLWHLFILLLIGAGVIGGTVYFLKYQFNEPAKPTPSPEIASPSPVPTATPTPVPTVEDRSRFTVRVLNGTTKSGWAGEILKKLKDAGFKTDRSGNATNSALQQTVIRVKEGTQSAALVETITKDLGSEFSPTGNNTLKDSDKADAEIILGQK